MRVIHHTVPNSRSNVFLILLDWTVTCEKEKQDTSSVESYAEREKEGVFIDPVSQFRDTVKNLNGPLA